MLDFKAFCLNKVKAQAQKCDNMASCWPTSRLAGVLRSKGYDSHVESRWGLRGVFQPPFSCKMLSTVKGSIAFEIFLVTPSFNNRRVLWHSGESLSGSTDQWKHRQTENSLCLLEGEIWMFSGFKSAPREIVLLYKTCCTPTAFFGCKKVTVIPWCCSRPLCPHMHWWRAGLE